MMKDSPTSDNGTPRGGYQAYSSHGLTPLWPLVCLGAVAAVLGGYLLLVVSNAIYLGWSDGLYFLGQPRMWSRVWLTVWTATAATGLSLAVGIPAGTSLSRHQLPWPRLMATLIDLPVLMPPAAVGAFLFGFTHTFPLQNILEALGCNWATVYQG